MTTPHVIIEYNDRDGYRRSHVEEFPTATGMESLMSCLADWFNSPTASGILDHEEPEFTAWDYVQGNTREGRYGADGKATATVDGLWSHRTYRVEFYWRQS